MPEQSLNYEEEEVSETDCIVEDVGAEELKEKAIASFLAIKGVGCTILLFDGCSSIKPWGFHGKNEHDQILC